MNPNIEVLHFCVFLIILKASTLVDGYLLGIKGLERYLYEFSQIYETYICYNKYIGVITPQVGDLNNRNLLLFWSLKVHYQGVSGVSFF